VLTVLPAALVVPDQGVEAALAVFIIGHEFAHGVVGQLRAASGDQLKPAWLPRPIAQWLARHALDEYLADRLAEVSLSVTVSAIDHAGVPMQVSSGLLGGHAGDSAAAAEDGLHAIAKRIHQYRLDGELTPMWTEVVELTSQVFITLAHAQAELDEMSASGPASAYEPAPTHPPNPLHDAWSEFVAALEAFPFLPTRDEYRHHEAAFLDHGAPAVIDFWAALGLTFETEGEGFHISVAPPESAWLGPG